MTLLKGFKKYIVLLSLAILLVYGTDFAIANNVSGYGGNMNNAASNISGPSNPAGIDAPAQTPPGQQAHPQYYNYSYGYGQNNSYDLTANNGIANMGQANFSSLLYGGWKEWASAYRSRPNYPYAFNFSSAPIPAGNNTLANGQIWLNGSWDGSKYGVSKKIARQRVMTILNEMNMLKTMANGSGLSAEDRASMVNAIDNSMHRLENADREIQAASDMKKLGEAVAKAEPYMAFTRSEIKANAGLMACKDMDTEIGQAMNASDMAESRIQGINTTPEERAWYEEKLAEYDGHVYNASQYLDKARVSFQNYSEFRDDAYFAEGLKQIEFAQDERDMAFAALKEIFNRSIND